MRVINQSYLIRGDIANTAVLHNIADAARVCYRTESGSSDEALVARLIKSQHEAMLEHSYMTVYFTTDRAVANELVRHRLASFAQESTRYCNYSKEKFGHEVTFIAPIGLAPLSPEFNSWAAACMEAEREYFEMLRKGATTEEARDVLPLSTATRIVVTANMREWRHILALRAAGVTGKPHPKMKALMKPLLEELAKAQPVLFGDIHAMMLDNEKEEKKHE